MACLGGHSAYTPASSVTHSARGHPGDKQGARGRAIACVTLPCRWCMCRVCGKWCTPVSVGLSMTADQKGCVERD